MSTLGERLEGLRSAFQEVEPIVEFYLKREINSPSNHQEFAREAADKLQRFKDALAAAAPSLHKEGLQSLSNCMDCGKEYGGEDWLDFTFSKAQWLLIHPADGGVLCANCVIRRASKLPHVINITGKITFVDDYNEPAALHKEGAGGERELLQAYAREHAEEYGCNADPCDKCKQVRALAASPSGRAEQPEGK